MPRFSILTPVHDPPEAALRAMVESVRAQTSSDWQLCLVDDGSTEPHVRRVLDEAARDARVTVRRRAEPGGIVAASNDALALATGELVALLDHDDLLAPTALAGMEAALRAHPDADLLYSDEDKVTADGAHFDAFLKPAWSPERLRTQMYTGHLCVLRRALVEELGGFRDGFDGSQDWDLVLRVSERARRVVHVPEILYHWRALPTSTASAGRGVKDYAFESGRRAIQEHCDRTGVEAVVEHDEVHTSVYHLRPALRDEPLVSLILPTRGTRRDVRGERIVLVEHCVKSIVSRSTYANYEVVAVVDDDTPPATIDAISATCGSRLRVVPFDRPFSFSDKINVGAAHARGSHLLMLNDDVEVVTPGWLESMVMYSKLEGVGAVGAKLLFGDGTVQHAGVVFDAGGPGHLFRGVTNAYRGYFEQLHVAANFHAVTGACLLTRREVFEDVGGLSTALPVNFGDIDYCLKVGHRGRRVVFDPGAVLLHFESSTRMPEVKEHEVVELRDRWGHLWDRDEFVPVALRGSSSGFTAPVQLSDGRLVHA